MSQERHAALCPRKFLFLAHLAMDKKQSPFLRILGMSIRTTCFDAPGLSLGRSGVSIGGVRILRV